MANEHIHAYMAGIVDGEGCVTISLSKRNHVTFRLFIGTVDERLVSWLQEHYGGCVHLRKRGGNQRDLYEWSARKAEAVRVLTSVYPYLVLKREQANIFLALAERQSIHDQGRLSADEKTEAVGRIRALNRRGRVQ